MLPFEDRYTRQRQLREVGLAGQQRLQTSLAVLGVTRSELVAADYLGRAGVSVQLVDARPERAQERPGGHQPGDYDFVESSPASHPPICAFEGPSQYLRGSLTALDYLRRTLGVGESPGPGSELPATNQSEITVC